MRLQMIVRRAGIFVPASLLLAHSHSPRWLRFCPLEMGLRKLGVER